MSDQTASVPVKVGNIVVWALQLALAAYFLYSGWLLFGDDFVKKFDEIGFGQWLRYLTGTLEIAGALGLLIPRLCGLAALGLFGVMVGAVSTELFLLDNGDAQLPALLGVVALVVAVSRRDTVKAVVAQVFGK
ncbi:DoxX family protein [Saccharothrix sp.]|uniref:DoxX family protein n=1 Tax=Saccharothrix sp. TaxID=1873460 RepID=UPI00281111FC|nr:DoxX family protein [Saccharothrix sp.]